MMTQHMTDEMLEKEIYFAKMAHVTTHRATTYWLDMLLREQAVRLAQS